MFYEEYERINESKYTFGQREEEIIPFMEECITHLGTQDTIHFVEIGLLHGCNFVFMGNMLSRFFKVKGFGIELRDQSLWKRFGFGNEKLDQAIQNLEPKFPYQIIERDSRDKQTPIILEGMLEQNLLDILFIDGKHNHNGPVNDFITYSRFVRHGGLIAFHDIRSPQDGMWTVKKAWENFRGKNYKEFHTGDKGQGIGVMVK